MTLTIEMSPTSRDLPTRSDTSTTGMPTSEEVRAYLDHAGGSDVYVLATRRLRSPSTFVYDAREALGIHD